MTRNSNKTLQERIVILPLPLWGLHQIWQAGVGIVRYFRRRRRHVMAVQGVVATEGKLFGTHKDPFCADAAERIWRLLNNYRDSLGLRPLAHNDQLAAAARYMGKRMLQKEEFGHVLSDGVDLDVRIKNFGYPYSSCGENLAKSWGVDRTTSALAAEWHSGWINSPGHHLNMIDPAWEEIGIAVVRSYSGTPTYFGIQNFGTPKW